MRTRGWATRLAYQDGVPGDPPADPTATYRSPSTIRITGFLRTLPDFAPTDVRITTGRPSSVPPSIPPLASYSVTCVRRLSVGLGAYSQPRPLPIVSVIARLSVVCRQSAGRCLDRPV